MAIVVETGTGLSNAQSYCDYAYFQAYMSERGLTFTQTQAQVEAALVIAAKDWIDGYHTFIGEKLVSTQALQFPRMFSDTTTYPDPFPADIPLTNAKAAWMHLQGLLLVDQSTLSLSGAVTSESKSVASLSKSVTYESGTAQMYARVLPKDLTNLLKPYLFSGGQMRVMRQL